MLSDNETDNDSRKSILKKSENKLNKKNVSIYDDVSIIDNSSDKNCITKLSDEENDVNILESKAAFLQKSPKEFKYCDRSTSPDQKFSMEEFLNNIDSIIDISKINEFEFEELMNNNKQRHVSCNTYYTNDVYSLHNINTSIQDKKKTKEERKKEREKKKEEEMLKKYQIEQEAKHKAIAKSKCGRWVKFNIKIGEGGYKFVYRGYDVDEAKNVAWCEFKREHVDTKEKRQSMFRETEIMLKMNHLHIVRCFDVLREWHVYEDSITIIDEKGIVIIQELMGEGTLKNIIKKNFLEGHCILKFPLITRWWHQILDALRYMHQKCDPPIIHRDLKADNCFLYGQTDDEYLNVKVGDFGLATHVHTSGRKTMLGTLGFMAPEIFDEKYDESVDIYAFGMLMLEVMTNRTPFDECDTIVQVAAKTLSGKGPKVIEMVSDKWLREIINSCIHPLSCFRPTAEELYFHPIFQSKGLPVEVELNYDNISDRTEVIDRFIANIPNCTKINLRLRFRDKRMLQELGLDDGESLEFDLDIYKAEDQDIPDLIQNLRLEYEDKLSRVYDNPKIQDKSTIGAQLDKLFLSIKLQMQCLVKHLLGRRWRDILDSLVANKTAKISEGEMESGDDQDEGIMNSFTIISQYKGMWTKAKRSLDKEMSVYRDNSHKDYNAVISTDNNTCFHVDGKQNKSVAQETVLIVETESLENEKPLLLETTFALKNTTPSTVVEGPMIYSNVIETEQMDNPSVLSSNILNKSSLQLISVHGSSLTSATNSNSATMVDIRDATGSDIVNHLDFTMSKDNNIDHCETDLQNIFKGSYVIKISNIESSVLTGLISVTFNVEIPDFSKSESGKWVLCFKCVVNENNPIIDNLELNTSDLLADKMDSDITLVLQETLLCILRLIQNDKKCVSINQNFIFYPRMENVFLSDVVLEKSNRKSNVRNSIVGQEIISPDDNFHQFFDTNTVLITPSDNKNDLIDNSNMDGNINVETLFQSENTILLSKQMEDDKNVVRAYNIPFGSAVVVHHNGLIQNIKKTTIISPKLDSNENIFVRELDKSDLSMDKAIHILSLLQEKIEELSTKEHTCLSDLTSKVLCEIRPNVEIMKKQPIIMDPIDKNKIIEQVLMQKTEIEKLQKQQSELISLLSNNQQLIFPPEVAEQSSVATNYQNKQQQQPQALLQAQPSQPSAALLNSADHDLLSSHKMNSKIYTNQYGQPYAVNSTQIIDPRMYLQNSMYVNPEELEYQNSNNYLMDNAIRSQVAAAHMKNPINENMAIFNSNNPGTKEFIAIDNNIRLKGMKDMADVSRVYTDMSSTCYPNEPRVEYYDRNIYQQLHFHGGGNDQINDGGDLHMKMNSVSAGVPNLQDFKQSDPNLTKKMYQSKFPYFYHQVPYPPNMRSDHSNYLAMKEKPMINYMMAQSLQNYYDPSMIVVAQQYQQNADEMGNIRKDQMIFDSSLADDMKLTDISFSDKQIKSDQNLYSVNSNFSSTENSNLGYLDNNFSINPKSLDKIPEAACINVQMNPIEEKIKDVFINR